MQLWAIVAALLLSGFVGAWFLIKNYNVPIQNRTVVSPKNSNFDIQIKRLRSVADNARLPFEKNKNNYEIAHAYYDKLRELCHKQLESRHYEEAEATVLEMASPASVLQGDSSSKWKAEIKSRIAEIRLLSGDLAGAEKFVRESIAVRDENIGNNARIAYIQANIALKKKDYGEAVKAANQMVKLDERMLHNKDAFQLAGQQFSTEVGGEGGSRDTQKFLNRFASSVSNELVAHGSECSFANLLNCLASYYLGTETRCTYLNSLLEKMADNLKKIPPGLQSDPAAQNSLRLLGNCLYLS